MVTTKSYELNAGSIVYAMLDAVWYNYKMDFVNRVITELKDRIQERPRTYRKTTHEGDLIYSTLVRIYGDYSDTPRTGWIYEEFKPIILRAIDAWLNEMQ